MPKKKEEKKNEKQLQNEGKCEILIDKFFCMKTMSGTCLCDKYNLFPTSIQQISIDPSIIQKIYFTAINIQSDHPRYTRKYIFI